MKINLKTKEKVFIGITCGVLGLFAMISSFFMAPFLTIVESMALFLAGLMLEILAMYLLTEEINK